MRRIKNKRLAVNQLERRDAPSVSLIGPNILANVGTTGTQSTATVAMDGDGDFVVAWQSDNGFGGTGFDIYARRFGRDGTPLVPSDMLVNVFQTGNQLAPAAAMDAAGDSVIVWQSAGQDGSGAGIYGQRYDSAVDSIFNPNGRPEGSQFRINTFTLGDQVLPSVAMGPLGTFVVVWQSNGQDGNGFGIYGQRFNAAGVPQGNEFRVNTQIVGSQFEPAVTMDYAGDFVVAWTSDGEDGSGYGVYARRYDPAGVPLSGEFRVNTTTANDQSSPSVAMNAGGDLSVAWQSAVGTGTKIDVQNYTANGATVGTETAIATNFVSPSIAQSANGGYAVTYVSLSNHFIGVTTITSSGSPDLGFTANANPTGLNFAFAPAVAIDASGNFVVAWDGEGAGDSSGVFGQRFHESTDTASPLVTGVNSPLSDQAVAEGERLVAPISTLMVAFSEDMNQSGGSSGVNSITNPANWILTREGNVISDQITSVAFAFNTGGTQRYEATLTLAAPLIDQRFYVLKPGANLRDVAGNLLDGDADGTPGGTFSRDFQVASPGPVGSESQVNTTAGPSFAPVARSATAADALGDYVIAWKGSSTSFGYGVYAQVYTPAGLPRGPEILVSPDGGGKVAVAMDQAGDFVIAYSRNADGSGNGVYARRFAVNSTPIGSEFLVNQTTAGPQGNAAVAMDGAGDMIFAWETPGVVLLTTRVFGRRFNPASDPLGNEFPIISITSNQQQSPAVAADAVGDFVIAYDESNNSLHPGLWVTFGADGGEIRDFGLTVGGIGQQPPSHPSIAMDAMGHFVVAWTHAEFDASNLEIAAVREDILNYDSSFGPDIVNFAGTTGTQQNSSISMDQAGDFVVSWESNGEEGNDFGIDAQRYSLNFTPLGGLIHVNTFTTGDQRFPAIAMDGDGDFVVDWQSSQGGSTSNIMSQRYGIAPPRVASVQVNNTVTDPQRSRVTSIRLIYSSHVNYAGSLPAAFTLTRQSDGMPVTFGVEAGNNNGVGVVTLKNFSGPATDNGSLADGRYTLRVLASQVSNLGGAFDGDGNAIGGDDYVLVGTPANGLFRMFGDITGDGTMSASDFIQFRLFFGDVNPAFDFDGDGSVSASDFIQFRQRFGGSI